MAGRHIPLIWQHDSRLQAPAKYRRACRYDAFVPEPIAGRKFKVGLGVAGAAAEAEAAIRTLNTDAGPALAPLARLLLRTESIASSKVEGMQLGVRELARAEARLESGENTGPVATEILSNIDAMALAIDEAAETRSFSNHEVLAIHRKLLERASNAHIAGQIRTQQNWIGGNDYNPCGADFVPPPPEYVPRLMVDLCDAVNDDLLPPLMQAALVHAHFETIHPFDDGNGRTGRALIHVVLRRRSVATAYVPPISVVLARSRERYISGLTAYREGGVEEWIEQFSNAATTSAQLATEYLAAVGELASDWRDRLGRSSGAPRADAAAWRIIDVLPGHPIITAPVAAALTKRSKPQIYQALSQLEQAEVLTPISSSKRNRAWEARGLLHLIGRLESGERP